MAAFQVQRRASDGKMPVVDIVLQIATTIALELPPPEKIKSVRVSFRWKGSPTVAVLFTALQKKHLATIDSRGRRNEARTVAREIILDVLARKKDWKPYAGIFAAFAERNDRDFFERLVRGFQRKRKAVFSEEEWLLLLNWEEWNSYFPPELIRLPSLKFWTDEAVLGLLTRLIPDLVSNLNLSGLRSKRVRLGLKQAKPARVTGVFPVKDCTDSFRIETAD